MTLRTKDSKKPHLTIIIPARNEEGVILKTLDSLKREVAVPHRIIVVNDLSTDNTERILRKYAKKNKNIFVVNTTPEKSGFSEGIKLGISKVKDGLIVFVMADMCDDPKTINFMYEKLTNEDLDVVAGSRYMKGGKKINSPKLQGIFSKVLCKLSQLLIGVKTSDATNSFKMYRKEILDKVQIQFSRGAETSLEMIVKAYFISAKIGEVPTMWKGRPADQSRFKLFSRIPRYLKVFFWSLWSKYRPYLPYAIFLLVSLLAYWQTLKMYFWVDDWGLVYKMIFPQDAPSPSNFGAGIFGEGAYRYNATPFIFLYPLLKLSAPAYFGLGLLQYFVAAVCLYLLLKRMSSGNEYLSFVSALIFSSGYIGSFAMYRLSNSYQLIETVIFMIITVYFLYDYYVTRKNFYYWLSLIFFILTLEFFFLRSQGIIFVIFATIVLFGKLKISLKSLLKFFVHTLPFLFMYYFYYFIDYLGGPESSGISPDGYLSLLKNTFLKEGRWDLIQNLFITLTRMFIPSPLISSLDLWLNKNLSTTLNTNQITIAIGIVLFVALGGLFIANIRKYRTESIFILFGVLWTIGNILIYYLYNPFSSLDSNSRYAIPTFVGVAITYAAALYLLKNKTLRIILPVSFSVILIWLTNIEAARVVKYVSTPDKLGFETLIKEARDVNQNTIFFVESVDDPNYKNNILGGVPQMAIPPLFGFKGIAKMAYSYEELYSLILEDKSNINNFYSYFYSPSGYLSTREEIKELLVKGEDEKTFYFDYSIAEKGYESLVNYKSLIPTKGSILLRKTSNIRSPLTLYWQTDKGMVYRSEYSLEIKPLNNNNYHWYNFNLPAQGTRFTKFKIPVVSGEAIEVKEIKLETLPLDAIDI